jgi:hypothetical protein
MNDLTSASGEEVVSDFVEQPTIVIGARDIAIAAAIDDNGTTRRAVRIAILTVPPSERYHWLTLRANSE